MRVNKIKKILKIKVPFSYGYVELGYLIIYFLTIVVMYLIVYLTLKGY